MPSLDQKSSTTQSTTSTTEASCNLDCGPGGSCYMEAARVSQVLDDDLATEEDIEETSDQLETSSSGERCQCPLGRSGDRCQHGKLLMNLIHIFNFFYSPNLS